MTTKAVIALATDDTEFGHVPADKAEAEAKTIANEEGKAVTLRDPVTDEVLGTIRPRQAAAWAGPTGYGR